jgi:hypothetical protein
MLRPFFPRRTPTTPGRTAHESVRMPHPATDRGVASHSRRGLMSKLPMRGPSQMRTYRSLWHVILRTGRSAGNARREPSAGTVRARATRGILVPALVLGSLGATAAASPGDGSTSHVYASAYQPAALSAGADSMSSCTTVTSPWMYSPWMYSPHSPWMYSPYSPWMYSPWMYALRTPSGGTTELRAAPVRAERRVATSMRHDLQRRTGCPFRWSKSARCRAALLAAIRHAAVTAPAGRRLLRCMMRP